MVHKYDIAKSVALVGARGYSGLELARILRAHPGVGSLICYATDASFKLGDHLRGAESVATLPMSEFAKLKADTVFLATPAEVSAELAPVALSQGADVIDLSGAFRLEPAQALKWYGIQPSPQAHGKAQYGLTPWVGPAASGASSPRLVANPGCYATSILMALLPLLKAGLIRPETLVIDAKSGASGAGRKAAENLHFCEVEGECLPYKVGKHQHLPEIQRYVQAYTGVAIDPMLSTHLLPIPRGIISGLYARTQAGVSHTQVQAAYAAAYSGYPLVGHGPLAEAGGAWLQLKRIVGTPRTEIRTELVGDQLYVYSLIDNLLKGAASQAVENFNRLYDLPLTEFERSPS